MATTENRIRYVEPNTTVSNNIPYPYEDYCISVKLLAKKTRRDIYKNSEDNNEYDVFTMASASTSNYITGENGILTTKYTDVSMVTPNGNTHECLGITSIDITYESWFHPQVVITFVDVRGASLFGVEEEGYRENLKAAKNGEAEKMSKSLYKDLFSMPPTMFYLRVKGFYGREVEYQLTVENIDGSFNDNTGNFELTVKFIGFMYGVYTDIPMSYVAVAPYMEYYGRNYWESNILNNPNFNFNGIIQGYDSASSPKMFKFLELKLKLAEAKKKLNEELGFTEEQNKVDNEKKKKDDIPYLLNDFQEIINETFQYSNLQTTGTTSDGNEYVYGICFDKEEYALIEKKFEFVNKIRAFNKKYNINTIRSWETISYNTKENCVSVITETPKDIISAQTSALNSEQVDEAVNVYVNKLPESWQSDFPTNVIKSFCTEHPSSNPTFIRFNVGHFYSECSEVLNEADTNLNIYQQKCKEKSDAIVSALMEFPATIENFHKLGFTHMDTFVNVFYNCLDEIKNTKNGRTLNELGITDDMTDLPSGFDKNKPVPPFTLFLSSQLNTNGNSNPGRVYKWAGELNGGENLPEVKFVRSLVAAGLSYTNDNNAIDSYISSLNETSGETDETTLANFIPLVPYDFINGSINPYSYLNNIEQARFIDYLAGTFCERLFYFLHSQKNMKVDKESTFSELIKMFIEYEAHNAHQALSYLSNTQINLINESTNSKTNDKPFIENLLTSFNDKNPFRNNNSLLHGPFIETNCFNYNWSEDYFPTKAYNLSQIDEEECVSISGGTEVQLIGKMEEDLMYIYTTRANANVGTSSEVYKTYAKYFGSYEENGALRLKENEYLPLRCPYVIDPSNGNKKTPLTLSGWYYLQNDHKDMNEAKLAKAYLYLMGMGISSKSVNISNWGEMYVHALRDGAFWWRFDKMKNKKEKDPIVLRSTYKPAGYSEYYTTERGNNDDFILKPEKKDSKKTYRIHGDSAWYDDSVIRSGETIELFIDWALNKFEDYVGDYEIKKEDGTLLKGEDFKSFMDKCKNGDENDIETIKKPLKNYRLTTEKIIVTANANLGSGAGSTIYYDIDISKKVLKASIDLEPKTRREVLGDDYTDTLNNILYFIPVTLDETNVYNLTANPSDYGKYYSEFITALLSRYNPTTGETSDTSGVTDDLTYSKDALISVYQTLKHLYDRWFAAGDRSKWSLSNPDSEFNSFKYIDSKYRKVGDKIPMDLEQAIKDIDKFWSAPSDFNLKTNTDGGNSFYNYLSDTANACKMILLALPMGNIRSDENGFITGFDDIFTPFPYNTLTDVTKGSTYVCIYSHADAEHLKMPDDMGESNLYRDDGWDISDTASDPVVLDSYGSYKDAAYTIPAFGVTYGRQNQSFFKNVHVSMGKQQVTDASIALQLRIGMEAEGKPQNTTFAGQNLYKIYSNYAYSCDVDMMGDAQIMPLMLFQLNNIPMFKGLYMINKVSHHIEPGNMTTKFSGVKLSRNDVPFVDGKISIADLTILRGSSLAAEANVTVTDDSEKAKKITTFPDKKKNGEEFTAEELKLSGRGMNRNGDTEGFCNALQEDLIVAIHSSELNGQPTTMHLTVNHNIKSDVEQIFKEIFNTTVEVDGVKKYFQITPGTYCYSYRKAQKPGGIAKSTLSMHSYGVAIDVNPHYNPYVNVEKAKQYKDSELCIATAEHPVAKIFQKYGWTWGGNWNSSKDLMHFSYYGEYNEWPKSKEE